MPSLSPAVAVARASVALAFLLAAPASAQQAPEAVPLSSWGPNSAVRAMSLGGDILTIGGDFTHVGPHTGSFATTDPAGGDIVARSGLRSQITGIESDGAGGWFVAPGSFILASRGADDLIHVLPDGTRDPHWHAPYFADKILAILRVGSRLFVAGSFFDNPGFVDRGVVALDTATGALLPWNAQLGGDPFNRVDRLAEADGRLYLYGWFSSVGGQPRAGLAAVDVDTAAVLPAVFPRVLPFELAGLAATSTGVYLSGTCRMGDSAAPQGLCGFTPEGAPLPGWSPAQRGYGRLLASGDRLYAAVSAPSPAFGPDYRVRALSPASGADLGWSSPPITDAASSSPFQPLPGFVAAMALDGERLYVGGRFDHVGLTARAGVAAFSVASGVVDAWHPAVSGLVWALAADGSSVAVGGQFKSAGGARRRGLAAIDLRTGQLAAVQPPELPGVNALARSGDLMVAAAGSHVVGYSASRGTELGRLNVLTALGGGLHADGHAFAVAVHDRTLYVGGSFTSVNGVDRQHLAAIDLATGQVLPGNPRPDDAVLRLEVSSGALYATGAFTTFTGFGRGGAAALDLNDLSVLSWNPQSSGVNDIAFYRERVLLGGSLHPSVGIRGTEWTERITGNRLDLGRPTQFAVQGIGRSGDTLVIGGSPYSGWSTANLMAVNAATGQPLAWAPRLADVLHSSISAVEGSTEYVAVAGTFDDVDGAPANNLAVFRSSRAGAPVQLTASVVNSTVSVAWQPGPPPAAVGYVVEAGTAPGSSDLGVFNVGSARRVASVLPAGTYFVRIRGLGPTGPGTASSEVALTVPALPAVPAAPANLTARTPGSGLLLSWNAATGNAATYVIEAGTFSGASNLGVVTTGNLDTTFLATVPPGTYFVRIRAVNPFGQSAPSNEVTIVVP